MDRDEMRVWLQDSGIAKEYRKARYKAFKEGKKVQDFIPFDDELSMRLEKDYSAKQSKRSRTGKRLLCMFNYAYLNNLKITFVTFTFNNDSISKTSLKTKRVYLTRFLKDQCFDYIANIDFGAEHGREHFHAVVVGDVDYSKWEQEQGFVDVREIKLSDEYGLGDIDKLKKYINKFENHCTKDTVGLDHIISKRGVKYPYFYYQSLEDRFIHSNKSRGSEHIDYDKRIERLEIKAEIARIMEGL